ncbi:MAG: tetratricopeptide repeat protein [Candidatus Brocadia sp.]|nr:tetratricopeptide repeat protein [Candidatus Brocadia sp.]MDG5997981.1 tetratricopeptide repeat protein [Candidatus Brocadia sp.]
MMTRKFQKFHCVVKALLFVIVMQPFTGKISSGEENAYKYSKQAERFKKSSFSRFQTDLHRALYKLEEKSDNLEAMNQNLEGRVNMLSSENDKLSKAHTQMRVKQATLEKEQARMKKQAASLEAAYKKLSNRAYAVKAPKKTKSVAQKKSGKKTTQKKTSVTKKGAAKTKMATKTGKKTPQSEKTETTSSPDSYSQRVADVTKPEEVKGAEDYGLDIKKTNEKGIEYGKKGMYDEAIREFQKVASAEPNLANVHYNLGLAYKKKGMRTEADREFAEYERLKGQNN